MTPREGFLVLLAVAAALVAAWGFKVASHPEETTDPDHAARFEQARAMLPVLGAVRVRTDRPRAADLLEARAPGAFTRIYDPRRAQALFRYGRMLYASKAEVARTLTMLKQGRLPPRPPPAPDLSMFFRDRRGPYACDVLLAEPDSLDRIRDILPDARLSGDPVARADEARALSSLPRALLALMVAAGLLTFLRKGFDETLRRLLAMLTPLALLALTGRGVDLWTLAALAVVGGAENGRALLCGLVGLFFPVPALHRAGIVLVAGGLVRLRSPPSARAAGWRIRVAVLAGLALLGWGGIRFWPVDPPPTEAVRWEPAAVFVPPEQVRQTASELRAAGIRDLVGDRTLLPHSPDRATRLMLREIFQIASRRARQTEGEASRRLHDLAEAAAVQDLYLRSDLKARLRTGDGRAVLWTRDPIPPEQKEFLSASLSRLRGARAARKEGRWAGLATFLLAGLFLCLRGGRFTPLRLCLRFCGLAAGVVLIASGGGAAGLFAPALAVAASAPGFAIPLALAAAAVFVPGAYLWPAAAFLAATLAGIPFNRR